MRKFFIIFILLLIGCAATVKNKVPNNSNAPSVVHYMNNQLRVVYSDNVYNKTGIKAMSFYNLFVVMYNNKTADKYGLSLPNLYKEVFKVFSNIRYDVSKFRYIAVGNYGTFTQFGNALFIDGTAFRKYLDSNDYDGLYANSNQLTNSFQWEADTDVGAILQKAAGEVDWDGNWGGGGRDGAYKRAVEGAGE